MNCTHSEPCLLDECKKLSCMKARQDKGIPLPRVEPPAPGDVFSKTKFANRRALLTYKTHLDKDAWIEWLSTKTGLTPDFVRLAHETGDKTNPYNHTHCVIDFGKVFQTINMSYFDYENIHPHIRVLKNAKALKDAKTYIAKEDPANKDLLVETTPVADIVWSKDSLQEALRMAKKPSDATGIIALYNAKSETLPSIPEWRMPKQDWQMKLMAQFEHPTNEHNGRKVFWYYDEIGGTGKSVLADYLAITEPHKWFTAGAFGNSKDASQIIINAISSGWNGHGIIIDLPRQAESNVGFYQVIEDLKNGRITSQKYSGKVKYLGAIPHVIVFANWKPNFSKLSRDRWVLRQIKVKADLISQEEIPVTPQMWDDSVSYM